MGKHEIELTDEEEKDLDEFIKHHPEKAKNRGEALKEMAGLKTYRVLKRKLDPERKKASVELLPQDIGMPMIIPCALNEQLDALGMEYNEFCAKAVELVVKVAEKALSGDKDALDFFEKAKTEKVAGLIPVMSLEGLEITVKTERKKTE